MQELQSDDGRALGRHRSVQHSRSFRFLGRSFDSFLSMLSRHFSMVNMIVKIKVMGFSPPILWHINRLYCNI